MTPFEQANLMRDAAAVKRYHTVRTLREQTVGAHTFGVMQLIDQIYPEARKEVYIAAMHHDLPELITGDIPAPMKRQLPRLAVLLEEAEKGTVPLHRDCGLTAFEEAVLKWCDLMELVLWCLEELYHGNTYAVHPCTKGLTWLWDAVFVLNNPATRERVRPLLAETTRAAQACGVKIDVPNLEDYL